MECIAKNQCFMENVFNEFRHRLFIVFECLGNRFSDFVSLENKLENTTIVSDMKKSEPGNWRGESTAESSPLKT